MVAVERGHVMLITSVAWEIGHMMFWAYQLYVHAQTDDART